jgi:uncharacterized protein (DUF1015 family)
MPAPLHVRPFRGLRYDPRRHPAFSVVAPPYDVITMADRMRLVARSNRNVVRLILPDVGRAENARRLLDEWRDDGTLLQEEEPCLYRTEETFTGPDGVPRVRTGMIALVGLPSDDGVILPHERTMPSIVEDRLQLLRATHAQPSPILVTYDDPDGEVDGLLRAGSEPTPTIDLTDDHGTHLRMWRVPESEITDRIHALLSARRLLIADGHHRYATALAYRDAHPEDPSANAMMMYLTNGTSPGLVVFPIHRIVSGIGPDEQAALPARLAEAGFVVADAGDGVVQLEAAMASIPHDHGVFGLVRRDHPPLLVSAPPGETARTPLERIDAVTLQTRILGPLLGLTEEVVATTDRIRYTAHSDDAAAKVEESGDVGFILRAPTVNEIEAVALSGEVMPQKSTYFYPKTLDGLVIRTLDGPAG